MLGSHPLRADRGTQTQDSRSKQPNKKPNLPPPRRPTPEARSDSLECPFKFGQSEKQPTETEDGASGSGTGALQGEYRRTQRDPVVRTRCDEAKTKFYEDLQAVMPTVPKVDKLIVLGDFNAIAGTECVAWIAVVGLKGIIDCNGNGLPFLQARAEHSLLLTNTFFSITDNAFVRACEPTSTPRSRI
nr:unnamed protein product [Spirometra erinaceieuropaei]